MSTFKQRRCAHCKTRYDYQTSGYRETREYDSETYCNGCYKVVLDALRAVPVKSKPSWVGCSDVSVETLVNLEQERWKAADAKGGLLPPYHRVLPGMVDLVRPDNHHKQGILHHDGRTYLYEYWTQQGGMDAGQVNVQVERDVATGDILGPWDLSDRWSTKPTFIEHPPWPDPPPATHVSRPAPMPVIKARRYDLIERVQSLQSSQPEPLRTSREYATPGPRSFKNELIPDDGLLPVFGEFPSAQPLVEEE